jgi:hypothetical protein
MARLEGSKDKVPRKRRGPPAKKVVCQRLDPANCDPRRVLQEIAINPKLPATARVAAAKALLTLGDAPNDDMLGADEERRIAARAVAMLEGRTLQ